MLDKLFQTIEKITPLKYRWILNHEGFKRYFANTGWMLSGQVFTLLVSFSVGAWVARSIGPESYGQVNYIVAFVGLFAFIAGMGLDGILGREIIKMPTRQNELLGTSFGLRLIGAFVSILLVIAFSFIARMDDTLRFFVILYSSVFVLQASSVISVFFQSKVLGINNVKAQVIATVVSSLLKLAFILSGLGIFWLILIYILDFFWQGMFLFIIYRKYGELASSWKWNSSLAISLWKLSWPLMFSSGVIFVYIRVDQVIVGRILGDSYLGIYSTAIKFAEIWYFIPAAICASLFPAIVNAKKGPVDIYYRRLKNLYLLVLLLAVGTVFITYVTDFWLVNLLFGEKFIPSVAVLNVYILSNLGIFLSMAVNQYFITENLIKTSFLLNLGSMFVNIILNLILIPVLFLQGAAIASVISYSLIPIMAWFLYPIYHQK